MSDRNTQLVEAALSVFVRYGVGKTTMNDIAKEAGVARQTLYNSYASKEDVLRASVRHVIAQTFDEVTAAWDIAPTFADQLDVFFAIVPLKSYDIAHASPEGAELFDGIHKVAAEELRQAALRWSAVFAQAIRERTHPDSATHQSADDLGAYVYAMSTNAKYNAPDRAALEMRLEILKQSVLALVGTDLIT